MSIGVRLALIFDGARELGKVLEPPLGFGRVLVAQPFCVATLLRDKGHEARLEPS